MKKLRKREKKKLAYLGIFISLSVLVILLPGSTQAWRNGWPGRSTAYQPDNWLRDYKSQTWNYYGTHDFIAEVAWDYTVINWIRKDGLKFANDKTFACFMLGTEVPDYAGVHRTVPIPVDQDCGNVWVGYRLGEMNEVNSHKACIDPATGDWKPSGAKSAAYYKGAATGAEKCMNKALFHLAMGQCEAAAYYMGAMVHYISDAGSFPHTVDNIARGFHHKYESYVNSWTGSPYWWNSEFMPKAYAVIWENHPWDATYLLAMRTFYGNGWITHTQMRGTSWMETTFEQEWTVKPQTPEFREYVERDLNNAIKYSASALVFIGNLLGEDLFCNCNPLAEEQYEVWAHQKTVIENVSFLIGYSVLGELMAALSIVVVTLKSEEDVIILNIPNL